MKIMKTGVKTGVISLNIDFFYVWMKITPVFTPVIILILKIENMDHVRLPTNGVLIYFDFSSLWRLMIVKFAI